MNFIEKLCACGSQKDYFRIRNISDIESKCKQNLRIIDFDFRKNKVCKYCKLSPLKSCDALKMSKNENYMDFIELKKIGILIEKLKKSEDCVQSIRNFDLYGKVSDSFVVIRTLMLSNGFKFTKEETREYHSVVKNFVLAIDINLDEDPLDFLNNTLFLLSKIPNSPTKSCTESFNDIIKNELDQQLAKVQRNGECTIR